MHHETQMISSIIIIPDIIPGVTSNANKNGHAQIFSKVFSLPTLFAGAKLRNDTNTRAQTVFFDFVTIKHDAGRTVLGTDGGFGQLF